MTTKPDKYAFNWDNYSEHLKKAFDSLLASNEFVDVTLSCEGKKVNAHKLLLSACSSYFHGLFRDNPCQHVIVILEEVRYQNLIDILTFIYSGEVHVANKNLNSFLKTAKLLQINGLANVEYNENEIATQINSDEPHHANQDSQEGKKRGPPDSPKCKQSKNNDDISLHSVKDEPEEQNSDTDEGNTRNFQVETEFPFSQTEFVSKINCRLVKRKRCSLCPSRNDMKCTVCCFRCKASVCGRHYAPICFGCFSNP